MIIEEKDIEQIQKIIIAFSNGDFSERIDISQAHNLRNALASGINMLGEELEDTTISRDYFGSIYNAVSDILIVTDNYGFITKINEACELITKREQADLVGNNYKLLITDEEELSESSPKFRNFEGGFITPDGTTLPIDCSISSIIDRYDKRSGYLIIAKDITDNKNKKEQELKLMVSTQEKERERFAYDMHDSLGQELNAINLSLSTMDHIGKGNEQYDEIFQKCRYMVNHSIGTMKKIAFDLMPKTLEDGNLCAALRELVISLEDLTVINYHFDGDVTCLEGFKNVIVYRVFQEFINNSMKHSKSSTINLLMKKTDGKLVFVLTDDGIGFDKSNIQEGNGLRNIESRLEAIQAPFSFVSEEDIGTTLKFEIQI